MKTKDIQYKWVQGGNVPGGHYVICEDGKKPFITPMKECNSIELRHSDIVVDIGAYVGTYAIRCARFPVKQVIAYEPTPRTFDILKLTQLPNLELRQVAVVPDERKTVNLFISQGIGVTNSIVQSNRKAGAITVPAISYKEAVQDASIVKIDVEGAEYLYPIVQDKLRAIIIDFHPLPGNWIKRAKELICEFEQAGFKAVVSPDFDNGWTRAGSWIRDVESGNSGFEAMLSGKLCCGCGCQIIANQKALCHECFPKWTVAHRNGYILASLDN